MTATSTAGTWGAVQCPDVARRRARPGAWRQHALFQAHEALLGRATVSMARRLARFEQWTPERIEALQSRKLRRLLRHAVEHCPYYRELDLQGAYGDRDLAALHRLPLFTRNDLRRSARRMCWRDMPTRRLTDHSSGTSDEPIRYYWDRRRQAWDKANRLRGHGWHGFGLSDRELHLWPVDPPRSTASRVKHWLRQRRDAWLGDLQLDSLALSATTIPMAWARWRRFEPARVTAYPSVLAEFIRAGRRVGCPMRTRSLRCVFLTGETTLAWQRDLIEDALRVPAVQAYGVQEAGALAFECERGGWHVSAESAIVEVVRDGRPAAPGELGEVVVTGLESLAMPVVRYCTGDVVRAVEVAPCGCGRGLPLMPPVLGRTGDFLEADDGTWIEPAALMAELDDVLSPGTFQIRQRHDGGIEVSVAAAARAASDAGRAVVQRLEQLLGGRDRVELRPVPALRRTRFGKCRYVQSERTAAGLACAPLVGAAESS